MRTTISIDDQLLAEAKENAARNGRTLGEVVDDALREAFGRRSRPGPRAFKFPTAGGGTVAEGVNLNSNSELLDAMDESRRRRPSD